MIGYTKLNSRMADTHYKAIRVNKRTWKQLVRDVSGFIFHRIDNQGQYWVKAAGRIGRIEIERYGHKAS